MANVPLSMHMRLQPVGGLDSSDIADLTRLLREELLELDVDAVEPLVTGNAPPGTKAGDPVTAVGTLVVTAVFSASTLRAVVQVARAWLERSAQRSITVETKDSDRLEITGQPTQRMRGMAEAFIERNSTDGGDPT